MARILNLYSSSFFGLNAKINISSRYPISKIIAICSNSILRYYFNANQSSVYCSSSVSMAGRNASITILVSQNGFYSNTTKYIVIGNYKIYLK